MYMEEATKNDQPRVETPALVRHRIQASRIVKYKMMGRPFEDFDLACSLAKHGKLIAAVEILGEGRRKGWHFFPEHTKADLAKIYEWTCDYCDDPEYGGTVLDGLPDSFDDAVKVLLARYAPSKKVWRWRSALSELRDRKLSNKEAAEILDIEGIDSLCTAGAARRVAIRDAEAVNLATAPVYNALNVDNVRIVSFTSPKKWDKWFNKAGKVWVLLERAGAEPTTPYKVKRYRKHSAA